MEFEVGKKYTCKGTNGKPLVIQITDKDSGCYDYNIVEGEYCDYGFAESSVFAENLKPYIEDLPRICKVLGGEDTPLKIGERFGFYSFYYYISGEGIVMRLDGEDAFIDSFCEMINHPEKIIRRPQFEDDDEALMREYIKAGCPWFARDDSNFFAAYTEKPYLCGELKSFSSDGDYIALPEQILSAITFENSPFNAKAYFESEGK